MDNAWLPNVYPELERMEPSMLFVTTTVEHSKIKAAVFSIPME
nr:hypothetical protein [Clostridium yunnanense]